MTATAVRQLDDAEPAASQELPPPRQSRLQRGRALLREHRAVAVLTVAALIFYLVHGVGEQLAYRTTGYDLGIFDQALRAYAHFKAPMVPLKGPGANIFGDHFHPIIVLLVPFYWIFNSPLVLIVAQAVLTAATIPIVYRFALRRTSMWMATLLAFAFASSWAIQTLIDFDFHEIAFATPLLALAIDALDRRDDRTLVISAGLLLFVREDMGVLVALLGVLLLAQRRGQRRLAWSMICAGAVMYWLTTAVIIPHFAHGAGFAYGNQFGALGPNVPSAVEHIVLHPGQAIKLFFQPRMKTATLVYLLLPLGFLSLRSRYAWLALPLMAERFFNSRANLWGPHFHYNALPWLVLVLAAADAGGRLRLHRLGRFRLPARRAYGAWLVIFPLLLMCISPPWKVLSLRDFRDNKSIAPNSWTRAAGAIVAHIPHDTCVEADNHLVPHLTAHNYVTLPPMQLWHADFIALDNSASDVGGNPPAARPESILVQAFMKGYTVAFHQGSWVLLRSPDYTGPSAACKPLGPGKTPH